MLSSAPRVVAAPISLVVKTLVLVGAASAVNHHATVFMDAVDASEWLPMVIMGALIIIAVFKDGGMALRCFGRLCPVVSSLFLWLARTMKVLGRHAERVGGKLNSLVEP